MKSSLVNRGTVAASCHFGWAENRFDIENYPSACVNRVLKYMEKRRKRRALDVGCTVGRSSFELAREFDEVVGIDPSACFIREAQRLKESGILHYAVPVEGEIEDFYEVNLKNFGLEHASKKVNFWQADVCDLKPVFSGFDLVLAANLIERLYDPYKFLSLIAERIHHGGLLIITSSYAWQEKITPKEKQIGGYRRDGENISALQGLRKILGKDFKLLEIQDIPFMMQETARKHQYAVTQMSIWER
jgi:putative 4-mercaptohistidine N1-methyltranferase